MVTIKLIVRDQGGHAVERTFGPIPLEKYAAKPAGEEPARNIGRGQSHNPDGRTGCVQPRGDGCRKSAGGRTSHCRSAQAADGRGSLSPRQLASGPRTVCGGGGAQVEALENDPDNLEARHDLAGIFYRQQDYDRAIGEYTERARPQRQLRVGVSGATLAYVAKQDIMSRAKC